METAQKITNRTRKRGKSEKVEQICSTPVLPLFSNLENMELTLSLTHQWKRYRESTAFMEQKRGEFLEQGRDLATDNEWLELVERYERRVIAPLERRWKKIKQLYEGKNLWQPSPQFWE